VRTSISTRPTLLAVLVASCVADPEIEPSRCEQVSSEILADDDVRLGTSAAELIALTQDDRPISVRYGSPVNGQSPLEHVFTRRGPARHVVYRFVEGDDLMGWDCRPEIRVPVSITLRSGDRRIDESITTDLVAKKPGTATWRVQHVPHGSLRTHDFDQDGWTADDDEMQLDGTVGGEGRKGTAILWVCDGSNDDSACTTVDAYIWGLAD
jgi:hypothetical protein